VELSPDGKLAYLVGNTRITVNDADKRPVTSRARLLNVWRKDPDGIWRCVVDVWVDEPASDVPPKG
jgi:ketosteroid isomerase-like protein